MRELYNSDKKLILKEELLQPIDPSFMNEAGSPKWREYIQFGDECGFDTRYKDKTGHHTSRMVLPIGKKVIRYGFEGGSFTTDEGEEYEKLSLPYRKETMPYHEYIVTGHCEVECLVDKGITAPGFSSEGGAVQYRHYVTIHDSLLQGILREDMTWL